jgi:hypothetical protein
MRAKQFIRNTRNQYNHPSAAGAGLKTYTMKIKLKQPGYTQIVDTTVQARTPEMARRIIRQQHNNRNVIVGTPREIKS